MHAVFSFILLIFAFFFRALNPLFLMETREKGPQGQPQCLASMLWSWECMVETGCPVFFCRLETEKTVSLVFSWLSLLYCVRSKLAVPYNLHSECVLSCELILPTTILTETARGVSPVT